jgi:hypothetical protein
MSRTDRTKTLEELEGTVWPYNKFGSHVVQESQRLRKVPIGELSVEDLRLLIGQKIGLAHLIPLAIEQLSADPMVAGAFYRGDLMSVVLGLPDEFWVSHPALNNELVEIGAELSNIHQTLGENLLPAIKRFRFRNF